MGVSKRELVNKSAREGDAEHWVGETAFKQPADRHAIENAACFTHDSPGYRMPANLLVTQRKTIPEPLLEGTIPCDDFLPCGA